MSKNKKKNKAPNFSMDVFSFGPEQPKEGQLRFHQKIVEKGKSTWYGWDYKELGRSEKVLQQFNGKDWKDIPFERDYIEI